MTTTSTRTRTAPRRLTVFTLVLLVASTLGTVGCGSNRAKPDTASVRLPPKHVHHHPKTAAAPAAPALAPSAPTNGVPQLPQLPRVKNDSVL